MQQDTHKTSAQLLDELRELRQRNIELETSLANSKEAEENIRSVSETALDAVIISDQDGSIVFWNRTATEIFGYEAKEVLGKPTTMLISNEAMGEYNEGKEHVLERGFSLFGKKPKESVAKRKDGSEFPAEFTVSHWKAGDKYYFGGSLRDISEQKRIAEEYERILNMSQDLICIAGIDGYFKYVNPAWGKMLGHSSEELLTKPFLDFIHPEDHQKNDEEVARLASGKLTLDFENRYIHKDGSIRTISWTAAPLPEKGLMYCVGRDITERKEQEAALKESEEQFRAVAASSSDAIFISDQDGAIIFWNNAAVEMLGYEKGEIVGKSYTMLLPERLRNQDQKAWQQFFKTGMVLNNQPLETIALRKDGSELPVETTFSNWKARDQYYFSFIMRDISERKQYEEALKESEGRFRSVAETSIDAIIISDRNGTIVFWNRAAEKIFSYEEKDILGKPYNILLPESLVQRHSERREGLIQKGTVSVLGKPIETMMVKKGDIEFPVEIAGSNWKARGRYYFSAILRDITKRKQQEEALREREERFRAFTESSLDAIINTDSTGKILYCNKSVERIYGYAADELVGKSIEVIEPTAMRAASYKDRDNFIREGRSSYLGKIFEGKGIRKDGTEVPVEVSTSHWTIGGKIIFGGIVRDITERKQMEKKLQKAHAELEKRVKQRTAELREANEELKISREYLKKFAGMQLSAREEERKNISTTLHDELGSMAVSVNSQISIAEEEVKAENRNATLKALERGKTALQKAVGDLRRLAVDLRPPNLEFMGLSVVLTDFLNKAKEHAKFKITFSNELDNKKIADAKAIVIYRVTQEAFTNITKHAKAKHVRVRLSADKKNINLEIDDDGVGFNQDKATSRKGSVTLKIGIEGMRERVESLGGEFIMTSVPKQGTQIKASLPKK